MDLQTIDKRLDLANNYIGYLSHVLVNNALGGNMWKVSFDQWLNGKGLDEFVDEDAEVIPHMVHPLGKYWIQPAISLVPIIGGFAMMDKRAFDLLPEYSTSYPSGFYIGKMWKREGEAGTWYLCWYGKHSTNPDLCSIERKQIKIHVPNYLYMYDTKRTLIIKENVEDFQYYVELQKRQQEKLLKAHYGK